MFDFKTTQNVKHITFKYTNILNYKKYYVNEVNSTNCLVAISRYSWFCIPPSSVTVTTPEVASVVLGLLIKSIISK